MNGPDPVERAVLIYTVLLGLALALIAAGSGHPRPGGTMQIIIVIALVLVTLGCGYIWVKEAHELRQYWRETSTHRRSPGR